MPYLSNYEQLKSICRSAERELGINLVTNRGFGYIITNRPLSSCSEAIDKFYSPKMLDLKELKKLTVLDVGSGRGKFVKDLITRGVKAFSLDASNCIPESIGSHVSASAEEMPFKSNSFDVLYSSYSIFSFSEKPEIKIAALKEMYRVLKQGGKIRLSPISKKEITTLLKKTGLPMKITEHGYAPALKPESKFIRMFFKLFKSNYFKNECIEIEKIK